MSLKDRLLENPLVYSLWTSSANDAKFKGICQVFDDFQNLKVLDVGCGPASNTDHYNFSDYVGVDINPQYIEIAQKKFPQQKFFVQDVAHWQLIEKDFDVIVLNSFIHHISDQVAFNLFEKLGQLLSKDGCVIISEPLIPKDKDRFQKLMMKFDRGKHFRTFDEYSHLFSSAFQIEKTYHYGLNILGLTGWNMVVMKLVKK